MCAMHLHSAPQSATSSTAVTKSGPPRFSVRAMYTIAAAGELRLELTSRWRVLPYPVHTCIVSTERQQARRLSLASIRRNRRMTEQPRPLHGPIIVCFESPSRTGTVSGWRVPPDARAMRELLCGVVSRRRHKTGLLSAQELAGGRQMEGRGAIPILANFATNLTVTALTSTYLAPITMAEVSLQGSKLQPTGAGEYSIGYTVVARVSGQSFVFH